MKYERCLKGVHWLGAVLGKGCSENVQLANNWGQSLLTTKDCPRQTGHTDFEHTKSGSQG